MNLKKRYAYNTGAYSIRAAVEDQCAPDSERSGMAERAADAASNTAALLAKLIETLHASGRLPKSEVLALLGGAFEEDES